MQVCVCLVPSPLAEGGPGAIPSLPDLQGLEEAPALGVPGRSPQGVGFLPLAPVLFLQVASQGWGTCFFMCCQSPVCTAVEETCLRGDQVILVRWQESG